MISKVICVCCIRDVAIWKISSEYIIRNIDAESYEVIVPDADVDLFRKVTLNKFMVTEESKYLEHRNISWLKSKFPQNLKFRAGWYLQQFVKIQALRAGDGVVNLVWDADTVPLKELNFIDSDEKLIYYKSEEYHVAYFSMIKRLIGFDKIVDFSFIAQCFAAKSAWVNNFCLEIEEIYGVNWIEAVVNNLDFTEGCGFSEYESLGTYFSHKYTEQMLLNSSAWQRFGNSLIGNINNLTHENELILAEKYDFISFESWDDGRFEA